jgi:hypothetical protein
VAYGCLEAEHVTHPVPSQSIPSLSRYQIGSAVHLLAVGLPLMVVSLACFLVIVPLAVFEGGVSLVGLRRGFLAWYGTVLAGAAAMARLGWDWLVRRRPLRQGSARAWWFLLAALLVQPVTWWAMLRFGSGLESSQYGRYLWAGTPLAGCAAHLAWLRWREGAGTTTLRT